MQNDNQLSRRNVLCGLAVLALGIVPDKAIAATGVKVLANGKVEVSLAGNPALRKVGGVVQFQDGSGRNLALVRTGNSATAFRALNLSCTHKGVTVDLVGSKWICQNGHGAEYAIDGTVKVGPAPSNLRTLPVKASKSKVVVG